MTRQKPTAVFTILILCLSTAAYAQNRPVPTEAPFATDKAASANSGSKLMSIYDTQASQDNVPLDRPHRTGEQLVTWTEDRVTAAMNIDPSEWDAHMKLLQPDFAPYGLQEYQNYLQTSGIMDVLKTKNLRLNAIMDGTATLLSEGALSGSYRWLYQVPLMISYYDASVKTAKGQGGKVQNQKFSIRVQIGRSATAQNDDQIMIERWSIAPSR